MNMKNNILVLLLALTTSSAFAEDTKCIKQIDAQIKGLNMGSFDHPSSCANKISM